MKKPVLLLAVVAAVVLASAAVYFGKWAPAPDQPHVRLVLAQNTVPLSSLTIIAAHNGYFAKHGLDVAIKPFPSGKLALDAAVSGGADIATVAETPLVRAHLAGIPVVVVANIAASENDIKLAYRKDLGITGPRDLKGKAVATAVGTSAEYFTDLFLAKNGLTPSDVRLVNLAPAQMLPALKSGDIAAFSIFEPYPSIATASMPNQTAVMEMPGLYTETFNIAMRPEYLRNNRSTVTNFLLALKDAQDFARTSPEKAIDEIVAETGIPRQTLAKIWPQFLFRVSDPSSLEPIMSREKEWIIKAGTSQQSSDSPVTSILDPSLVKSISQ